MLVIRSLTELRAEIEQRRRRADERRAAAGREGRKGVTKAQREAEIVKHGSETGTWAEALQLLDALESHAASQTPLAVLENEKVMQLSQLPRGQRDELVAALKVRLDRATQLFKENSGAERYRTLEATMRAYQHAQSIHGY